jgi:hypothetical protein
MGIYRDKRSGSFIARTDTINGKREYLGAFKTEEAADKAYQISKAVHERGFIHPLYEGADLAFELPKQRVVNLGFFKRLFKKEA